MSAWSTPRNLRQRLQKLWQKGRLLSTRLSGEPIFPLRLPLKHPGPRELGERFAEAKAWIEGLMAPAVRDRHFTLEWREINHRQLGRNRLPVAAVFERPGDALAFIGRQREAERFDDLSALILDPFPELRPWLIQKPLPALSHADSWPRLLSVLQWLKSHPRPGIYIRQLEIPEVDTKFIETHRALLSELLDRILPGAAIDFDAKGVGGFEQRYGFLAKPAQIRFRFLDPALYLHGLSDLQIRTDEFAALDPAGVARVFITENDINGLAFPPRKNALVIFGLGYGLERLCAARWLSGKAIVYWGDIDSHGFAMLDQIRHYFPQTRSILMDAPTLLAHRPLWGEERSPTARDLPLLTPAEAALYDGLRQHRWAEALRMEQERISYTALKAALQALP